MSVLKTETVGQTVVSISTLGGKSKGGRKRKNQKAAEEWNKKVETKIRTSARLRDKLNNKKIAEEEAAEAELAAQITEIESAEAPLSKNKKLKAKRQRKREREAAEAEAVVTTSTPATPHTKKDEPTTSRPSKKAKSKDEE